MVGTEKSMNRKFNLETPLRFCAYEGDSRTESIDDACTRLETKGWTVITVIPDYNSYTPLADAYILVAKDDMPTEFDSTIIADTSCL